MTKSPSLIDTKHPEQLDRGSRPWREQILSTTSGLLLGGIHSLARRGVIALSLLMILGVCGCSPGRAINSPDVSTADVAAAFHSQSSSADDGSFDYRASNGDMCSVAVVLLGDEQMKPYLDAGDSTVRNPSQTVGVKIVPFQGSDEAACLDSAEYRMRGIK